MNIKTMKFDWDELDNRKGRLKVTRDGNVVIVLFHDEHRDIVYVINESYQPVNENNKDQLKANLTDSLKRLDLASVLLKETHPGKSSSIDAFVEKMMCKYGISGK